ncbi:Photosystem I P700 chlorophyll a apoprotein A2 [Bacteroidales bacterium Barb6]|nr:Photosystem I P700 chlorophyll a apoprotein A2 [Bacteroidales bacterium Barb6]
MAELKRKVTLKRKTSTESGKPIEKGKNKFVLPIVISFLLLILIGGYFLFRGKSTAETEVADIGSYTTEMTETIPENIASAQVSDSIATETEQGSDLIAASDVFETTAEPTNEVVNNKSTEPTKGKSELPYKPNVAYKVYLFPFGVSNYSQPDANLDKLVKVMTENSAIKVQILAYTDNVGSVESNQVLSQKRAKAIYDYLASKGIDKSRLSYQGKGISTQYSSDAENRRAEFILN